MPSKWSPIIFDAFKQIASNYGKSYLLLVGLPEALKPVLKSLPIAVQKRIVEISEVVGEQYVTETLEERLT